jgi:uncharacterized GH25 family protein
MKRLGIILLMLATMSLLQSHEFWLEPVKYKVNVGEEIIVDFKVGENFMGQPWDLGVHKVERMMLYEEAGAQDLLSSVPTAKNRRLKVPMTSTGTKVLAMKSKADFIELDAEKFNEYLEEDGLDDAKKWRIEHNQENRRGTEFYTRFTKLIVQVGDVLDDTWKKPIGHRLEITSSQNPGSMKAGDYMDCTITWDGKPVPHIKVKVWGHVGNRIFLQNIYSEDDGTIRFPISASGPWLVSAVKMQRSKTVGAEWESFWSSLVFNIN